MGQILFDKQMHDFGTVPVGSVQQTTFKYIGDEELVASDFETTCTCTAGMYNPVTKEYTVGLKTEFPGDKSTTVKIKTNKYFLILKMVVVA